MSQYILLIHNDAQHEATEAEWAEFISKAQESGVFRGGSEIGDRTTFGNVGNSKSSEHIAGFMRFDSEDRQPILDLLEKHPVVIHGGTVELCEMPET